MPHHRRVSCASPPTTELEQLHSLCVALAPSHPFYTGSRKALHRVKSKIDKSGRVPDQDEFLRKLIVDNVLEGRNHSSIANMSEKQFVK